MTVGELIAELGKFDPNLPAIVNGYEGGYHDCSGASAKAIILDVHDESYYGPHEDADYRNVEGDPKAVEAVLIG